MWKTFLSLCPLVSILLVVFIVPASAQLPAFPGAEGGGRFVTGGRGGQVYYVNTVEDQLVGDVAKREGSLRWCLNQEGAKTILFKCSGNIQLKSPLIIKKGNVTIAGQSAPGDGICISHYPTQIDADNVIVRFIRFRMGDQFKVSGDALWARNHSNIIIDHCSMSWSTDECASFYSNKNFTLQWSIIAEALRKSNLGNGMHGYGGIWGGENASFHHNLLANNDSRNPRFNGWKRSGLQYESTIAQELVDFRNNVIYNWSAGVAYGGENAGQYNIVNNVYRFGPASKSKFRILQCYGEASTKYGIPHGRFHLNGNYIYGNKAFSENNTLAIENQTQKPNSEVLMTEAFPFSEVTTHSAIDAFKKVLSLAGCSFKRDTVDARLVDETKNGTIHFTGSNGSLNGMIDSQKDVGGWPEYKSEAFKVDTDLDGMPDDWEAEKSLDPKSAADGKLVKLNQEGYTNLEVYLNGLVEKIALEGLSEGVSVSKP